MEQRCENCRFVIITSKDPYCWCRRFPPDPKAVRVQKAGWCGEWELRKEEK